MGRKGRASEEWGFSLIELLIVMAVIAIIAAVAVPNLLTAKKAANEAAAIAYVRTWSSAQEIYLTLHQSYATSNDQLVADGLVTEADPSRLGYMFVLSDEGNSLAWSGTAAPAENGVTGDRFFFLDQTGVIRWARGGPADASSPPLDSGAHD
ncbi:MAG: prepilin-type N-terminal cleavage/methylation domain-containing protein [Acidobacteriota bacterium]